MPGSVDVLLPIDLMLRFLLFGLECVMGRNLSAPEVERVFREAAGDQVSCKTYQFLQSHRLSITGRVDESEPETLWLRVEGPAALVKSVGFLLESAESQVRRIRRAEADSPDSRKPWFDKG